MSWPPDSDDPGETRPEGSGGVSPPPPPSEAPGTQPQLSAPGAQPPPPPPGAYPPPAPYPSGAPVGGPGGWQPPGGAPPGGPLPIGPFPQSTYGQVRTGGGRTGLLAVVVVLALVAGVFAVVNVTAGGQSGAASPDDATRGFFDALADEDLVGMLEMLDPAERDVLVDFVKSLESEMSRLGITESVDLRDVPGLDLEVEGLEVSATELGPGVAQIDVLDGLITFATEPEAVPVGDVLRDLIEADGGEVEIEEARDGARLNESGDDTFLIATQTGGRWHLSLSFTIAEYARRDAGMPPPDFEGGVTAQGADTAEGAVRDLVDAATALDAERLIALLPPDQMRALQVYAPLFLDDAEQSAEELRAEDDFDMTVEDLELETTSVQGGTRVIPTGATVDFTTDEGTSTLAWEEDCLEVSGEMARDVEDDFGDTTVCFDDVVEDTETELDDEAEAELEELMALFDELQPGVVVVERAGAFYVDPLRTFSDVLFQMFEGVERSDLEEGGILYRLFTGELSILEDWESWDDCYAGGVSEPYDPYEDELYEDDFYQDEIYDSDYDDLYSC